MLEVLAPTMIDYAPAELAAEMVPKLLSGEEQWCQGFSEPGSGSDLASLTTRAVQQADNWIVNGQKVWTSFAQYSHRCILLTRTGDADTPNHEAITAFFVDLDTPGITVRPLRTMHGVDEFCEVYFDDVAVPEGRMLGKPGDGWRLAMDLLPYERSTCFWQRIAYLYSRLDALIHDVRGVGQAADAEMGEAYLALHTLRCRSRATQHRLAAGDKLGPDTSIDKVLLAGAEQRLYDTAHDLLPGAVELDDTDWRTEYLYSRAATIYGGTAEVQRNIIARRLLDLGKE
jgi:alkylation response protein AidB-like acyl-CoA dehydrogenase